MYHIANLINTIMNDTSSNERNEQMVKVMAVVGFVVLVCLLAWLAVQVVRFIPTVFSSLADVFEDNQEQYADNVNNEDDVVVVDDSNDQEENEDNEEVADNSSNGVATSTPTVSTTTPVVTTPKPAPVQYKTVTTYKKPVSDPNGKTDLTVTFVGVGQINSSGKFVVGALPEDREGAMQFVVKNIGTKTSNDWSFEATLPNGTKMNSKAQKALLPSESSTLTLVFNMGDEDPHNVGASVTVIGDSNLANNSFGATLVQR